MEFLSQILAKAGILVDGAVGFNNNSGALANSISWESSNMIQVNNGTPNAYADLKARLFVSVNGFYAERSGNTVLGLNNTNGGKEWYLASLGNSNADPGSLMFNNETDGLSPVSINNSSLKLKVDTGIRWTTISSTDSISYTAGISVDAANRLQINTGTDGVYGSLKLNQLIATSLAGVGTRVVVTDANGLLSTQAIADAITSLTGEVTATGPGAAIATISNAAVIGKVLTGLNLSGGGTISATDTILQAFGKIQNQISGITGGVVYQGVWNASTNTPTITSSTGTKGYYYVVNVAGSTNIDGITDWKIGDWIIFNGATWDKVDNTDAVSSVNGQVGAVSLTTANIPESGNLYYTDVRSRAALSFAAGSGAYNSSTGVITIPTDNSQILNGAGYLTQTTGDGRYVRLTANETITGLKTFSVSGSWSALSLGTINLTSSDNNISFFETSGSGYAHVGMNDSDGWFGMQSAFSNVRIKGGANNSNKREVGLYTGDTLGFYIDVNANSFVQNQLNVGSITSLATAASVFLTSDFGVIKSRTAAQVLSDINGVSLSGSYANPSWITSLAWSKITSTPTTLAGYGITDAVTGSGATNRLAFWSSSSVLSSSSSLTWDGTFLTASNFLTGGRVFFGGGSGGSNDIRHDGAGRFIIKSDFDIVTIQGGANNSNKRQIDFWTGTTESAYFDNTGIFWKSASSPVLSTSDNSLKFATTEFVKGQGYLTSAVTSLTGTSNQVNVSASTGAVTLSLPQSIATTSSVTFGSVSAVGSGAPLVVNSTNSNIGKISLQDNGTIRSSIGASSNYAFHVQDSLGNARLSIGITNGRLGIGSAAGGSPVALIANTATNIVGFDNQGMNSDSLAFAMSANGYVAGFYNGQDSSISNGLAVKIRNTSAIALDVSRGSTQDVQGTLLFRVLGNGRIQTSNPGGNANTVRFGGFASQSGISNSVSGMAGTQFVWEIEIDGSRLFIPVWTSLS